MESLLIVVPTLDSYKLLPRLCDSLLEQTWTNWEVLFVDGPSSLEHKNWLNYICSSDNRFSWIDQSSSCPGIFGAMNQGFQFAEQNCFDWVLFWGSDDWATDSYVLSSVFSSLDSTHNQFNSPDLIVCRGRYVNPDSGVAGRPAFFHKPTSLDIDAFRRALFFGATPPHQATLFGRGARNYLDYYSLDFWLSADLDYFLRLSSSSGLCISCLDLSLVCMSDAGVSGQHPIRRLKEVVMAYRRSFGLFWVIPFLARYFMRIYSLLIR